MYSEYLNSIRYIVSKVIEKLPCAQYVKNYMSDRMYLKHIYRLNMGHELNLNNPCSFSEKLQWLKLYNRCPMYVKMVDKYEAKKYVASCIGEQYIIPTICVWDRVEDIEWDNLPNQFVLKCTHDSGGLIICKDKMKLNVEVAKKRLQRSLEHDYFMNGREWPYKDVPRKIIAEKFIAPIKKTNKNISSQSFLEYEDLRDYKFFCFNGKVHFFKVDFGRFVDHHANYYSVGGVLQKFGEANCPPDLTAKIELPNNIDKMIVLAEKLSKGIPFLRVDFYDVEEKIYFGELTFYPASGWGKWTSFKIDEMLGSLIDLHVL